MKNVERKVRKILRRLGSGNRRAAWQMHDGTVKDSSSGSDLDDLTQHSENEKISCRSVSSRHVHHKSIMAPIAFQSRRASTKSKELFSEADQQELKEQHSRAGPDFCCDDQVLFTRSLIAASTQPPSAASENTQAGAEVNSFVHHRTCESEDVDDVSDYSAYGQLNAARKSANELDISVDDSLPESWGRESGYLSGIDLRYSASAAESPALSPCVVVKNLQPLLRNATDTTAQHLFHDEMNRNRKGILQVAHAVPRRLGVAGGKRLRDEDAEVPDYETTELLLSECVAETKYITTIFELASGGIVGLIDDVLNEFGIWFNKEVGLIGIACEVQWSVPEKHRHRAIEMRMKEALHRSLRQNNRRVLNMKSKTGNYQLPLTMISADTAEGCEHDCQLDCFQGIHRRFYKSLLPYQHADTGAWHRPYWTFHGTSWQSAPQPNPKQFLFGRDATKLDSGCLVAVNVIALKIVI
ncbi:unnamed protein product [Gongylonema pulchrum]|uniref:Uncharacterized protein n=1 Tax=Gongylonema pulchrum TaxID=637853 RepID=A0A183CYL0_9BILA|nr:unnamed protein product [Gongylonema pulchrum]